MASKTTKGRKNTRSKKKTRTKAKSSNAKNTELAGEITILVIDGNKLITYAFNIVLFAAYAVYLVRRERIDVGAMLRAALKRK